VTHWELFGPARKYNMLQPGQIGSASFGGFVSLALEAFVRTSSDTQGWTSSRKDSLLLQVQQGQISMKRKNVYASASVCAIKNSVDEDPVGYSTVLDSSVCNEGLVL